MQHLAKHLPKNFPRPLSDLAGWEIAALEAVAERPSRAPKRAPIEAGEFWAVAQTVPKLEYVVRRDIEKANHGAFAPTCARFWSVDGKQFSKERPMFIGYVFFRTNGDDWAGIRDIHGVYSVPAGPDSDRPESWKPMRVLDDEMYRVMVDHASGAHNETLEPRYTKYYRGKPKTKRKEHRRRRPRPGRRLRNITGQQSPHLLKPQEFVSIGGQR